MGNGDSTPADFDLPFVDVRDVAQAHLKAIEIPEAKGDRFILSAGSLKPAEVEDILNELYGKDTENKLETIKVNIMGGCMMCFLFLCCYVFGQMRKFKTLLDKGFILDNK